MRTYGVQGRRLSWQQPHQAKGGQRYVYDEKQFRDALGSAFAGEIQSVVLAQDIFLSETVSVPALSNYVTISSAGNARLMATPTFGDLSDPPTLFQTNGLESGSIDGRLRLLDLLIGSGELDAVAGGFWECIVDNQTGQMRLDIIGCQFRMFGSSASFLRDTGGSFSTCYITRNQFFGSALADTIGITASHFTENNFFATYDLATSGSTNGENVFACNRMGPNSTSSAGSIDTSARTGGDPSSIVGNVNVSVTAASGDSTAGNAP